MGLDNFLALLAGWALAIIGSILTDVRRRRSQKNEVKRGILIELQETQVILVLTCYSLTQQSDAFDRTFLTWILPYLQRFRKNSSNLYDKITDFVNDALKLSDEQISALFEELRHRDLQQMGGPISLSLKTILLPYTDSKLSALALFKEDFQRQVLSIRRDTKAVNEDMELARYLVRKTFESLSDKNHQIVQGNIDATYRQLAGQTRRLVDKIQHLRLGNVQEKKAATRLRRYLSIAI